MFLMGVRIKTYPWNIPKKPSTTCLWFGNPFMFVFWVPVVCSSKLHFAPASWEGDQKLHTKKMRELVFGVVFSPSIVPCFPLALHLLFHLWSSCRLYQPCRPPESSDESINMSGRTTFERRTIHLYTYTRNLEDSCKNTSSKSALNQVPLKNLG